MERKHVLGFLAVTGSVATLLHMRRKNRKKRYLDTKGYEYVLVNTAFEPKKYVTGVKLRVDSPFYAKKFESEFYSLKEGKRIVHENTCYGKQAGISTTMILFSMGMKSLMEEVRDYLNTKRLAISGWYSDLEVKPIRYSADFTEAVGELYYNKLLPPGEVHPCTCSIIVKGSLLPCGLVLIQIIEEDTSKFTVESLDIRRELYEVWGIYKLFEESCLNEE